ncbi:MAG TPA: hypothetical protein DCS93_18585 [Microscillaceae bacterium]|nr:hypothetical protein [Microscillaceae bacterium]
MTNLIIEKTKYTPFVSFNADTNLFEISGESYSEDSVDFYQPLIEWLEGYLAKNKKPLTFNFFFIYFNTNSSQFIYEILEILETYYLKTQIPVQINWQVKDNDDDMMEDAENFQESFDNLPFKLAYQQLV